MTKEIEVKEALGIHTWINVSCETLNKIISERNFVYTAPRRYCRYCLATQFEDNGWKDTLEGLTDRNNEKIREHLRNTGNV